MDNFSQMHSHKSSCLWTDPSQSAVWGVKPRQATSSLSDRGEEMLPSISSAHFSPRRRAHTHWEESISMRVGHKPVLDSEVFSSVGDRGNTMVRLCSRLCQRLSCLQTLLWKTCSVGRGGGGFPASVTYIWKRMEMLAPSGFMNKKGHKRAAAVT